MLMEAKESTRRGRRRGGDMASVKCVERGFVRGVRRRLGAGGGRIGGRVMVGGGGGSRGGSIRLGNRQTELSGVGSERERTIPIPKPIPILKRWIVG